MSPGVLQSESSRFLELPTEIRLNIFKYLVSTSYNKCEKGDGYSGYRLHLNFLQTNRQIHEEGLEVLKRENIFIRLDTPWREAAEHVNVEGRVPLLAVGKKASRFKAIHMSARIEISATSNQESYQIIIALQDLKAFCKTWYYADLSHMGMNNHFKLTITFSCSCSKHWATHNKELSKPMQKKLLLPFGIIKGLHDFEIKGKHDTEIAKELKDAMAIPYDTPEQCLEKSSDLKNKGNASLKEQKYREAIQYYEKAFEAIHIVVDGRRRDVYADGYFEKILTTGPSKGEYGITERFKMRIVLVANIIQAYLKLENYEEARFWGQRSISIMRENLEGGFENPHPQFPARISWGKLLFRTALACKALGQTEEYVDYVRFAAAWIPNDPIVEKERAACAPRLL